VTGSPQRAVTLDLLVLGDPNPRVRLAAARPTAGTAANPSMIDQEIS
jgi:hypothetical protein